MAANNLRVIYQNKANSATISASSTAGVTSVNNLKKDSKSSIWRSVGTTATLTVVLSTASLIGGVILPFCNLTSTATIRVTSDSGVDTGTILCCPYQALGAWDWGTIPLGINAYSYGGGAYARVWFPIVNCTTLTIVITDTANTSGYIEAARLIVGSYWSPKYNTSFGLSTSTRDLSTHERSESGDLITNRGIKYASLNFDLNWLTSSDRLQLTSILRGGGMSVPLFISLFPDNTEDYAKEQTYQVYGKLTSTSDISHPMFGIYSSQIDIEEI